MADALDISLRTDVLDISLRSGYMSPGEDLEQRSSMIRSNVHVRQPSVGQ